MRPQIPWLRVFVEGVVIVGSILLAFGIDAWWDGRQERALERDTLERLEAEFSEADGVLADYQANHQGVLEGTEVLLEHVRPDEPPALSVDSIASLLGTVRVIWTLDASFSTLSAFEGSGQLSSISSRDLLVQLASFRSVLVDLQQDEASLGGAKRDQLIPHLHANVSLRLMPIAFLSREAGASAFDPGFEQLLQRRETENVLFEIAFRTANTISNYDQARESLAALRDLIRSELRQTS